MAQNSSHCSHIYNLLSIGTEIFTVCHALSQEAQDAFYDANLIAIYGTDGPNRPLARYLLLDASAALDLFDASAFSPWNINPPAGLKKLKIVTITVRNHAELCKVRDLLNVCPIMETSDDSIRCINFGRYEVNTSSWGCKFFIECSELITAWPQVLGVADSMDMADFWKFAYYSMTDSTRYSGGDKLAFLLATVQLWQGTKVGARLSDRERSTLNGVFVGPAVHDITFKVLLEKTPASMDLSKLNIHDHGQEAVGLASDWMFEHAYGELATPTARSRFGVTRLLGSRRGVSQQ